MREQLEVFRFRETIKLLLGCICVYCVAQTRTRTKKTRLIVMNEKSPSRKVAE